MESRIPTRSRSEIFSPVLEVGTPELRKRRHVTVESLDHRGLVRRARVTDQTLLDTLLADQKISPTQHAGGDALLSALVAAGATPRSPGLEPFIPAGRSNEAERGASMRILAARRGFRALRAVSKEASQACFVAVLSTDPKVWKIARHSASWVASLREGLDALARSFGIGEIHDPRR
tara:strand:- start:1244 stop:1774 length:531 start_codon:yes stop_codon:yes gene_type:complete